MNLWSLYPTHAQMYGYKLYIWNVIPGILSSYFLLLLFAFLEIADLCCWQGWWLCAYMFIYVYDLPNVMHSPTHVPHNTDQLWHQENVYSIFRELSDYTAHRVQRCMNVITHIYRSFFLYIKYLWLLSFICHYQANTDRINLTQRHWAPLMACKINGSRSILQEKAFEGHFSSHW